MTSIQDQVAALLEGGKSAAGNEDEKTNRTEELKGILEALKNENADELAAVSGKLADAARDASWRIPIGDSGILDLVLSSIPGEGLQHPLNRQALRLIGNACADCDENRARVVESGKLSTTVKEFMADDALVPFAIAATLNACVDYEKAQLQVCEAGLGKILIDIVSGPRLSHVHLSHVMTILEMLSSQASEPKFANPDTPALLLKLATSNSYEADLDTFLEICSPALAYLTHQDLQPHFLSTNGLPLLQQAFFQSYTRFDTTDADADTADQLKQVWTTFVAIFADISAQPAFAKACALSSPEAQTLTTWLDEYPQFPHLQTAACLSLGNLSRSDEVTLALLPRVQSPLCSILVRAIPPKEPDSAVIVPPLQLIHAALSFLKNLAIPAQNKPLLGSALFTSPDTILPRLWTTTTTQPQLQFTGVSLARLLLVNCPENISLIVAPQPNSSTSLLSLLSETAESADESPTKMEAARATISVCRALHSPSTSTTTTSNTPILKDEWAWSSPSGSEDSSAALNRFYSSHSEVISTSFTRLIAQPKFPPIKTDAIFVLALMSRSEQPAGATTARQVLENNVEVFKSIIQAVTGSDELVTQLLGENKVEELKDEDEDDNNQGKKETAEEQGKVVAKTLEELSLEPKQADSQTARMQPVGGMNKVDRENGLVLVAALLQRFGDELTAEKRKLFEEVLRVGGELVVKDREEGKS
ncbi:Rap1 GTPase-GDP dissociation stimulator 1-B [Cladorrhinum sp. PSN332]|nr:Rap1 GTPase-GDP dissociation stimulator 1-B [Cladorrhinum sp. PSN332]